MRTSPMGRALMRGVLNLLLIALAVSLSACSAATLEPTATATDVPTPTLEPPTPTPGTPTATLPPTATHLPNAIPTDQLDKSVFHFHEANPVLQQTNNRSWDNVYLDPGAMVYHDGQFHMFYNGINGFPAPVGVGYATSPDGYVWTRQVSEPLFSGSDLSGSTSIGSNLFVTSALVEDDGTWVLYYYTLSGGTFIGPGDIGRATAPSPSGPWTLDPEPVLSPGPSAAWDAVQVVSPDVKRAADGYVMYYDAFGNGTQNASRIGMATSTDGIQWTKYNDPDTNDAAFAESDPVLTPGEDSWEARRVLDPNVLQTSDGWEMIYLATTGGTKFSNGTYSFGYATSEDGIHWNKSAQNPVLSTRNHPQWANTYLATLLHVNDTYFLYFDLVTSSVSGTNVYLATYEGELQ